MCIRVSRAAIPSICIRVGAICNSGRALDLQNASLDASVDITLIHGCSGLPLTADPAPLPSESAHSRTIPSGARRDISDRHRALDLRLVLPAVFKDLVFYFKYASTAYGLDAIPGPVPLPLPRGNVLLEQVFIHPPLHVHRYSRDIKFDSDPSKLKGFIVRNDNRKEIVIALRGRNALFELCRY